MNKLKFLFILFSFSYSLMAQQSGGMWIPTEINEKEMKSMGMKLSATDIFNPTKPSIEDAIAQFNGGCTSEIISPKGLLLTNHHCGYSQIQSHSSVEKNYLRDGFWAKNNAEELPNPGVYVTFIVDIKEVTSEILNGTELLDAVSASKLISSRILEIQKKFPKTTFEEVEIKPMYAGNKYYLFKKLTYRDIRLVAAPPESIGKFGSDTDNWVWPRHTGDFSVFRIYANKDNQPAEYSKDNIPFKPKHFLPVSVKGIKENDFTMVYGFPGRTNEYLPAIALEKLLLETNPAKIKVREIALEIQEEKMRKDEATKIKYASKYATVANYWKKWIGENQGLERSNAIFKRKQYEESLISMNPKIKEVIVELEKLYNEQAPFALAKAYYDEVTRNAELLRLASNYQSIAEASTAGNFNSTIQTRAVTFLKSFYKDYDPDLDLKVVANLLALYAQKVPFNFQPGRFVNFREIEKNMAWLKENHAKTLMLNPDFIGNLDTQISKKENIESLLADPYVLLVKDMKEAYTLKAGRKNDSLQVLIDDLQKKYMALQMQTDKNKKFFPDANSTLRVTYGKVKGSKPKDGVEYHYQTYLDGVVQKYVPGDYEFDLPADLLKIYENRDFGSYTDHTGRVPVGFTGTNHTTGGNSGSPAIDAKGNLIGLNFDRQWEGTMSDLNYDPEICRNIMVDTRYILFVLDKLGKVTWLLDEMKIVK
jgi:hypothetical protein